MKKLTIIAFSLLISIISNQINCMNPWTDPYGLDDENEITQKKLNFDPRVSVVLIPTKQELIEHNVAKDIWWNDADLVLSKQKAVNRIKTVFSLPPYNKMSENQRLEALNEIILELDLNETNDYQQTKIQTHQNKLIFKAYASSQVKKTKLTIIFSWLMGEKPNK